VTHEIITVAQMRDIDAASAGAGVATRTLMERAGRAVAAATCARFSPRPTAVLCGPGNNGGDGWVTARALQEAGWPVWVETLTPVATLAGDAAYAARGWNGQMIPITGAVPDAELFVDALFGAGLSRPLDGGAARLAALLPTARIIAVDVPSGLHGDTGKPLGEACFRAALTVTFVRKKPAHVLVPGRAHCGEVVVADIGAPEYIVQAQNIVLRENDPSLWLRRWRWPALDSHKHARGHAAIASGPATRTGASRLAARGALRIGAGLVTILAPPAALAEHAAQLNAIMLQGVSDPGAWREAVTDKGCVVVGPAFGTDPVAEAGLAEMLGAGNRCAFVLDADALTIIARGAHAPSAQDILTPHVGEFRRVFPGLLEQSPCRIEAAREAARRAGCTILLKGPDTVIAAADGRAIVNTTGGPYLATAGSGDVLAGMIGGLVAQGMDGFMAAAAAAWLHGKAGEAGPGLIAEDIPELLPKLLRDLAPGAGVSP
jgi:hydroxyethylthiazole kinase-like uncharacterized protein yjeF